MRLVNGEYYVEGQIININQPRNGIRGRIEVYTDFLCDNNLNGVILDDNTTYNLQIDKVNTIVDKNRGVISHIVGDIY